MNIARELKEFFSIKNLIYILTIFSLLLSFVLPSFSSSDKLNWKIGDYWEYEVTNFLTGEKRKHIEEMRVIGKENISFYGKGYSAYKVEIKELNETLMSFYRINDLAEIGVRHGNYSIISDPPLEKYKFLEVGKKWNQSIKWIQNSGEISNTSFVMYFECLEKRKIKTQAGEFECYKIKSYSNLSNSSSNYGIEYFSPYVKNTVLSISYENGKIIREKELIKASYRKKKHGIPSFTFPMMIPSFIYILWLIKRKKEKV